MLQHGTWQKSYLLVFIMFVMNSRGHNSTGISYFPTRKWPLRTMFIKLCSSNILPEIPKLLFIFTSTMLCCTVLHVPGTHPLKPFAALAHSLLRNELHLWSSVFSSRCTLSTDAYVSVCDAIVKEMKITIFPSIPEGDRNVKSKVHVESSSSDVGRQVRHWVSERILDF